MPLSAFQPDEGFARRLDAADSLARFRERFHLPLGRGGQPLIYFSTHSLGLQARATQGIVERELERWAKLGVEGHFAGDPPWYTFQEPLRPPLARLLGAQPDEVVLMNGLTVNLHLLFQTFFRPSGRRRAILLEHPPFPSDLYAVQSQLQTHGLDPEEHLLWIKPHTDADTIAENLFEAALAQRGDEIALVWLNPVNFLTGQWFDVPRIVRAAHRQGCPIGLDLAHATGNVPLALDDWDVDFAVGCTYKYLCGGPGAVGFAYVHAKHGDDTTLPRLAGWWGNDPATRFRMHLEATFVPVAGAAGWQVSNPPIFGLAPLHAALPLFAEAGMPALREKSVQLTGYLEFLLQQFLSDRIDVLTPHEPGQRGCQLSLRVPGGRSELLQELRARDVVADFRPPDVLRVAPAPLYNTFHEVWRFVEVLRALL